MKRPVEVGHGAGRRKLYREMEATAVVERKTGVENDGQDADMMGTRLASRHHGINGRRQRQGNIQQSLPGEQRPANTPDYFQENYPFSIIDDQHTGEVS